MTSTLRVKEKIMELNSEIAQRKKRVDLMKSYLAKREKFASMTEAENRAYCNNSKYDREVRFGLDSPNKFLDHPSDPSAHLASFGEEIIPTMNDAVLNGVLDIHHRNYVALVDTWCEEYNGAEIGRKILTRTMTAQEYLGWLSGEKIFSVISDGHHQGENKVYRIQAPNAQELVYEILSTHEGLQHPFIYEKRLEQTIQVPQALASNDSFEGARKTGLLGRIIKHIAG